MHPSWCIPLLAMAFESAWPFLGRLFASLMLMGTGGCPFSSSFICCSMAKRVLQRSRLPSRRLPAPRRAIRRLCMLVQHRPLNSKMDAASVPALIHSQTKSATDAAPEGGSRLDRILHQASVALSSSSSSIRDQFRAMDRHGRRGVDGPDLQWGLRRVGVDATLEQACALVEMFGSTTSFAHVHAFVPGILDDDIEAVTGSGLANKTVVTKVLTMSDLVKMRNAGMKRRV